MSAKVQATVILTLIILHFGCSKSSQDASDYPDSLIILNGASNVRYEISNGIYQVYYKIIAKYPAKDTIDELNKKLETKGWHPLLRDWLNPEIPTSLVRGWTNYVDGTKKPNLEVYAWISDWTNESEDILTYSLSYSYPVNSESNMLQLDAIGLYVPAEIAKLKKNLIEEYRKTIGEK